MLKINNLLAVAIIDLGLFGLIGWCIYDTHSLWPLFLIFFMVTTKDDDKKKDKENTENKEEK